jgi:hypothetical protein
MWPLGTGSRGRLWAGAMIAWKPKLDQVNGRLRCGLCLVGHVESCWDKFSGGVGKLGAAHANKVENKVADGGRKVEGRAGRSSESAVKVA